MQANCFIFPSPKIYNLDSIKNKIILIPRQPDNNRHKCYESQCTQTLMFNNDEFSEFLSDLNQAKPRQEKEISRQSTQTECEKNTKFENTLQGNLLIKDKVDNRESIPCVFIRGENKEKVILFFHANGEDICTAYEFLRMVNAETKISILAMEYRGYSIYEGQTTPINIEEDASRVLGFLQANKFSSDQIIVFGRSIGCAVALTITQKFTIYCAILLSPFISLKKVAKDLYGGCASLLLKEAFNNEQNCKNIKCSVLIIHGEKDTLVSAQHSLALLGTCQAYCRLKIIQNMTHTKFNFRMDFIRHFKSFLHDIE